MPDRLPGDPPPKITTNRIILWIVVAGVGLCEASAEQAYLKECIIRQAADIFVLADCTKLGRARQQHWTPMERAWTLVTDASATTAQLEPFHALKQVRVAVAS